MSWAELPSSLRYALAFGVPLVAALLLTPAAGRIARRFGVLDHPSGHKTHRHATPYLGGMAVAAGLLVVGAVAASASGKLLVVVAGAVVLGAVGLLDDVMNISPFVRLSYETVGGVSLWLVGIRAGVADIGWIDLPVTVLWVVAVTNAFNLIDNMDGLAAGVGAAAALGIAAIAARNGDYLVASLAFAVAGASLGFLRYNLPPARIFLGDAGAMFLGYLVAAMTLQLDLPVGPATTRGLSTVLLVAVPLFDLTLVVAARIRDRRPVWRGATDHLSHRLIARGRSRERVLATAVGAQAGCSALAFVVYRQPQPVVLAVGGVVLVLWVASLVFFLRMPAPSPEGELGTDGRQAGSGARSAEPTQG